MPDSQIALTLSRFDPITLAEMDGIRLMNRTDSKYVTQERTLLDILSDAARRGYRVLSVDGLRISPYNSLYFDTPELAMYLDHHNRRLTREKIRTRVYLSSGQTFLEIKRKSNTGRTRKKRIEIPPEDFSGFRGNPEACQFLAAYSTFPVAVLQPRLTTAFDRITLVNPEKTERLTIDLHLQFHNLATGRDAGLDNAVIIELKQDGRALSPMRGILLSHRVKPLRVSKYCVGTVLTDPSAKSNRFKTKIRKIRKIINEPLSCVSS